jgi:hypothetical protein
VLLDTYAHVIGEGRAGTIDVQAEIAQVRNDHRSVV